MAFSYDLCVSVGQMLGRRISAVPSSHSDLTGSDLRNMVLWRGGEVQHLETGQPRSEPVCRTPRDTDERSWVFFGESREQGAWIRQKGRRR